MPLACGHCLWSQACQLGSAKLPIQCHDGSTTKAHVLLKSTSCSLHLPHASLTSQLKGRGGVGEENSSMVRGVLLVCLCVVHNE